ncbi:hydroxymethylbilane synthase [Candidatus Sumerlaeota bacterium]|nr:hydroxymethylbilane synthase [Candidatus Sumerlaeota bacterium]
MHGRQPLRIGTRATALALAQTHEVMRILAEEFPDTPMEIVEITSAGDQVLDVPIAEVGGSGVFTSAVERALIAGEIEIAVHSAKDLPSALAEGCAIGAALPRADARDVLVTRDGINSLDDLPQGARVGTSSPRRQALLRECRPDLELVTLRGNVPTRLSKLDAGEVDATVLAAAGLLRLGLEGRITCPLADTDFIPAPGQGIIAVEVRKGEMRDVCKALNSESSMSELMAERAFLAEVNAGCHAPVGARAWRCEREVLIKAVIADPSGHPVHRSGRVGPASVVELNGKMLAQSMLAAGGKVILDAVKKALEEKGAS